MKHIGFVGTVLCIVTGCGGSGSVTGVDRVSATAQPTPRIIEIVSGDKSLTVEFDQSAVSVTRFEYSIDAGISWTSAQSPTSPITITGLTNGVRYNVAVRAVTETGTGHASSVVAAMPFIVAPAVEIVRAARKPGNSSFIPQRLDMGSAVFAAHAGRALERYRAIYGRDAVAQFEKVQAAADYVANMAKHPYRHNMNSEVSDPRAWEFADYPEKLAELATKNQSWNGMSWEPSAGKTLLDVPPMECTFQNLILGGIVNAMGLQWMIVSITAHDAFAYYDLEFSKWIYVDATYNEAYKALGIDAALSPLELHEMSSRGDNSMLALQNSYRPFRRESEYHLLPYALMHPLGFGAMAIGMNGTSVGSRGSSASDVRVIPDGISESVFAPQVAQGWRVAGSNEDLWAPQGETYIDSIEVTPFGNVVHLSTNLAVAAPTFERSVNGGAWTEVAQSSGLNGLTGEIRFRSKYFGFTGGEVIIRQAAK